MATIPLGLGILHLSKEELKVKQELDKQELECQEFLQKEAFFLKEMEELEKMCTSLDEKMHVVAREKEETERLLREGETELLKMETNPMSLEITADDYSELASDAPSSPMGLSVPPTPTTGMPNSSLSSIRGLARSSVRPVASENPSVCDASEIDRKRVIDAEERARKAEMEALAAKQREDEMRRELEQLKSAFADKSKQEALNRAQQESLQRQLQEEQRLRALLEAEQRKEQERKVAETIAEQMRKLEEERKQMEVKRLAEERKKQAEISEASRIIKLKEQYYAAEIKYLAETRWEKGFWSILNEKETNTRYLSWFTSIQCQSLISQLPPNDPEHQRGRTIAIQYWQYCPNIPMEKALKSYEEAKIRRKQKGIR